MHVLLLAAVLYVNDSDLLHMAKGFSTNGKFLVLVQSATNARAGLVHATGGSIKPQKCFWYMMGWQWIKAVPLMRKLCKLLHTPLMIPQPNGARVAITLKDVSDPEKS